MRTRATGGTRREMALNSGQMRGWRRRRISSGRDETRAYRAKGAMERECGGKGKGEREKEGSSGDDELVEDRVRNGGGREKPAVPIESEMTGRKPADAVTVEGVDDEHDDRQIDESENEHGVN